MDWLFGYDFALLYRPLLEYFRDESFGPRLATALVACALLVLIGFWALALPRAVRLRSALRCIQGPTRRAGVAAKRDGFRAEYDAINAALERSRSVEQAWREFRETLLLEGRETVGSSVRPQNFFTLRTLHVQFDFVRSLPNVFVGLGLLGTFIGLIAALTFSTQSLTSATDQSQIKDALNALLTTAAAKFYISAAGLVSSIVLALLVRLTLKYLHGLVHSLNSALEERLSFVSEQTLAQAQLSAQQQTLEQLKPFNTDVVVNISDAVRSAIEQSNNGLTDKLSGIADTFLKLVEASSKGATDAVDKVLGSTLRDTSASIGRIAASLQELPAKLEAATTNLEKAGEEARSQQAVLASQMQHAMTHALTTATEGVQAGLREGADEFRAGMQFATEGIGHSASRIVAVMDGFSRSSDEYLLSLAGFNQQHAQLESNLATISDRISGAAHGLSEATVSVDRHLQRVLTSFDEFSRVAADSSAAVRTSQEAVQDTVAMLQSQMQQHIGRFDEVDEKLAGVFNAMNNQMANQTGQLANKLVEMDNILGSAVSHFAQVIEDLGDVRRAAE